MQLCVLKGIKVMSTRSHARIFTNFTLQLNLIHFLIKIRHCISITFRRFDVPMSSVKVEGRNLIHI